MHPCMTMLLKGKPDVKHSALKCRAVSAAMCVFRNVCDTTENDYMYRTHLVVLDFFLSGWS